MRVTYYQRRQQLANFSIERIFSDIRRALPDYIYTKIAVSRFPSRGFWKRGYNAFEAAFRQGDVNHITGDVHYLAFFLKKRRTLLTVHDLISMHRLRGIRRAFFLFFWYWLPIKRVSLVTVISESTKNELLRHIKIDPRKIRVIYDCVSEDYQSSNKDFNTAKPLIIQIGTGYNKNLCRVAEALHDIPCHLRIIGMPNVHQQEVLRKYYIEYSFIANITDAQVVEEYRLSDMLVFASTYEGFGLPIIEAQATGRPVITSNIMSMPEAAGDGACLVDPFDTMSIREGVLRIIEDKQYREELVRRGLENVKRFRSHRIATEYFSIYQEIYKKHFTADT
jgi:glycosyltransferase involved in cell wall biosynthesis